MRLVGSICLKDADMHHGSAKMHKIEELLVS
jgi:hypothetical protein